MFAAETRETGAATTTVASPKLLRRGLGQKHHSRWTCPTVSFLETVVVFSRQEANIVKVGEEAFLGVAAQSSLHGFHMWPSIDQSSPGIAN